MAGLSSQWRYSHFEGLHAMLDQSAVAVGDVGKSLRDLTVAVEKLDQRIEEFWPADRVAPTFTTDTRSPCWCGF